MDRCLSFFYANEEPFHKKESWELDSCTERITGGNPPIVKEKCFATR